jgi:hypothetical protein
MSEEIKNVENLSENNNPQVENEPVKNEEAKPKEPTVQELMNELAKVKKAQEKAASEAAEYKKKYNATLTEKEQASIEKAEKEAEREQQFQELMRENKINKLEKSYLAMNYTVDEASRIAIAEADGDFDARMRIMAEADARKMKQHEAEWLKSRPRVNMGGDGVLTKEQFNAMSIAEKSKLYKENKVEYDRLSN